ncbi:group I truncated hemoglobin [Jiulongibacter sp. NS-SX5]|uniref:group I truncated hemoglobin n=1 Tax=Jiulongibacter sp. NS-SX5 TaxID=3463854 RepID=UPI0040593DD1
MEKETLYDKIGGEETVDKAVTILYEKVAVDDLIFPFFEGIDTEALAGKLKRFFIHIFGGPAEYDAQVIRDIHINARQKGLSEVHFMVFAGHLMSTFKELNVPQELIYEVMVVAAGAHDNVLGVKKSD